MRNNRLDEIAAREVRRSQIEEGIGLNDLNSRQKGKLLKYVKRQAKNLRACQHLIKVHQRVPHPKYGDRVPYFETAEVPDPMQCPCAEAQRFRAELQETGE